MAPTEAAEPVDFVPKRAVRSVAPAPARSRVPSRPGRCGSADGPATGSTGRCARRELRRRSRRNILPPWRPRSTSARSAPSDGFDLVLSAQPRTALRRARPRRRQRPAAGPVERERPQRMDQCRQRRAARAGRPSGLAWPVDGPITSYFGYRYHPILHFTRFHAGVDIGAELGQPDRRRRRRTGRGGRLGRRLRPRGRIAHGGGIISHYSHMSEIVAQPGSFVRRGQLIGYVGSIGAVDRPAPPFRSRAERNSR